MSSTYYLRALTLTVLSFAAGFVVIGASVVVSNLLTLMSSYSEGPATVITAVGILVGCGVAVGGLIGAIGLYQSGVEAQQHPTSGARPSASEGAAPKQDGGMREPPTYAEIRRSAKEPRTKSSGELPNAPRTLWAEPTDDAAKADD